MNKMRTLTLGYAIGFFVVVALGYIPGFTDSQGLLFGSFKIDVRDDVLHALSGIWAAYAAWKGTSSSRFYFRAFGSFYTFDALLGMLTGYAVNDLLVGDFTTNASFEVTNITQNLFVNAPHLFLGPIALIIGFVLHKKLERE